MYSRIHRAGEKHSSGAAASGWVEMRVRTHETGASHTSVLQWFWLHCCWQSHDIAQHHGTCCSQSTQQCSYNATQDVPLKLSVVMRLFSSGFTHSWNNVSLVSVFECRSGKHFLKSYTFSRFLIIVGCWFFVSWKSVQPPPKKHTHKYHFFPFSNIKIAYLL